MGDILKKLTGRTGESSSDRQMTEFARGIHQEVREQGQKVDGAMALGGHVMRRTVEIDLYRRQLAGDDQLLNKLLADVELTALGQAQKFQRDLFDDFGM